jgi:transcriptional regulator with XRE-family HTH domain
MGIHQIFGHNLRTRCQKFESIAEACRAIGINRQQFNKYLSGAMLPNARTMQRICEVFGIEEWEFFIPEAKRRSTLDDRDSLAHSSDLLQLVKALTTRQSFSDSIDVYSKTGVQMGLYKCFFPLPGIRGCLVPSIVSISTLSGFLTFTRHTRLSTPSSKNLWMAQGKHRGLVLSNGTFDYMIGYNVVSPNNISFMCFPRDVTGGTGVRIGLAIIQGVNPLFACRVALTSVGTSRVERRAAFNANSSIHLSESNQEKIIADILHTPQKDGSAQLALLDFHEMMMGANVSRA